MRIATWNVNGLRAALRKGFPEHLERIAPDVLMLQEVRALPEQLPKAWQEPEGWHATWHPAEKKGYAGTAIWTKEKHEVIARGIEGDDVDPEGRVLTAKYNGAICSSIYLPSGSSGDHRQAEKEKWMEIFRPWADGMKRKRSAVVLGGDFNIAHTTKDIFYAKSNEKNSGFLPHEREWMGALIESGWQDFVREEAGDVDGPYTWWSNRGKARELDRGWRIDYLLGNKQANEIAGKIWVDREAGLACSDHAPVILELD
ncbi:exodeoxyribonuclease III [Poriferisphaera sp. WC338]|uniref:exodeoxyribonuclease III n=1 Tax=Poriferisphaera sp. WC338 TaxID=3425129 RepID=UPI003D816AA5